MTIISKTAGSLSVVSSLIDIHKTAVMSAKSSSRLAYSDSYIRCQLGNQKANLVSEKNAKRKNWVAQKNFLGPIAKAWGGVKGYVSGFAKASVNYIPHLGLSAVAIFTKKHKKIANIAAIGLGGLEIYDYIKNSTGITQKKDYLK